VVELPGGEGKEGKRKGGEGREREGRKCIVPPFGLFSAVLVVFWFTYH